MDNKSYKKFNILYEHMKGKCINQFHSGHAIYFCIENNCHNNLRYLCSECIIEESQHFNKHLKFLIPIDNREKFLKALNLNKFENKISEKNINTPINNNNENYDKNPIIAEPKNFNDPKQQTHFLNNFYIKNKIEKSFKNFYKKLKTYILKILISNMKNKLKNDIPYFEEIIKVIYNDKKFKKENKDFQNFINKIDEEIENFVNFKDKLEFNNFYIELNKKISKEGDLILNKLNVIDKYCNDNNNEGNEIPFISDIKINKNKLKQKINEMIDEIILSNLEPNLNKNEEIENFTFEKDNMGNIEDIEDEENSQITSSSESNNDKNENIQKNEIIKKIENINQNQIEGQEEDKKEIPQINNIILHNNTIYNEKEIQINTNTDFFNDLKRKSTLNFTNTKPEIILENLHKKEEIIALTNNHLGNENQEISRRGSNIKSKLEMLKQRFSVIK